MIAGSNFIKRRLFTTGLILVGIAGFVALSVLQSKKIYAAGPTSQPVLNISILDRPVGNVSFQDQRLDDVFDSVRHDLHVDVWVDWAALRRASTDRDKLVTAHVQNAKLSDELEAVFKSVGGKDERSKLRYMLDGDILKIITQREYDKHVETRLYRLDDILSTTDPRDEQINELKKYITDHVAAANWAVNGGDPDVLVRASNQAPVLLITQTPDNLAKIDELFKDIRANPGVYRASPGI
jgi:type II secretory pathway component GspD/PulD (secretin)